MPNWSHTLDVSDIFHDDALTVARKGEIIAARIKGARWFDPDELDEIVDYLANIDGLCAGGEHAPADVFDEQWSDFYDWCDWNRVWVQTFPKVSAS